MNFRRLMLYISVLALAILVALNMSRLEQFIVALSGLRWYMLLAVIGVQLYSYYANAKYYQEILRLFGYELGIGALYEASLAVNFVNQAFPAGGLTGISYLNKRFEGQVPAGKLSLAQLMRYGFTVVSYFTILVPAFIVLFFSGDLQRLGSRLTLFILVIILVLSATAVILIRDRTVLTRFAHWVVHRLNGLHKRIRPKAKKALVTAAWVDHFIAEFYHGYEQFLERKGHWRKPFLQSLGGNLAEVATIWVVFVALGQYLNLGSLIAAYTLANLASLISPLTGGAGVYEATMVATLVGAGVPFTVAFTGTLIYRVFNMAVFLPIGFYCYQRSLKRG